METVPASEILRLPTPEILHSYSYDTSKLRSEGNYSARQLRAVGFDAIELREGGFTALDLRCAGFSPLELRECGFDCAQVFAAGFSYRRLRLAGFSAQALLLSLNTSVADLKNAGYLPSDLNDCFSGIELYQAGFSAEDMKVSYRPHDLVRFGYCKADLKPLGMWPHDGRWQYYNQYWDCCFGLDRTAECCGISTSSTAGAK